MSGLKTTLAQTHTHSPTLTHCHTHCNNWEQITGLLQFILSSWQDSYSSWRVCPTSVCVSHICPLTAGLMDPPSRIRCLNSGSQIMEMIFKCVWGYVRKTPYAPLTSKIPFSLISGSASKTEFYGSVTSLVMWTRDILEPVLKMRVFIINRKIQEPAIPISLEWQMLHN